MSGLTADLVRDSDMEALGINFERGEARRADFLEALRASMRDPEFRKIEGFPLGEDADILSLSAPPYYTACPNPFIREFVDRYGTPYKPAIQRVEQPYAGSLRSQSRHPVCTFHPYHTKAPPEVIRALIEHYTEPGDLVLTLRRERDDRCRREGGREAGDHHRPVPRGRIHSRGELPNPRRWGSGGATGRDHRPVGGEVGASVPHGRARPQAGGELLRVERPLQLP